jgi:hypothetical protein
VSDYSAEQEMEAKKIFEGQPSFVSDEQWDIGQVAFTAYQLAFNNVTPLWEDVSPVDRKRWLQMEMLIVRDAYQEGD